MELDRSTDVGVNHHGRAPEWAYLMYAMMIDSRGKKFIQRYQLWS